VRFLFLHGSPGFNSFAEQAILGPVFLSRGHQIEFWTEPSRLRPNGAPFEAEAAYERLIASITCMLEAGSDGPVVVIAHSFTNQAARFVLSRHPAQVAGLVLVAPAADAFVTYANVLRLAHQELLEDAPQVAAALWACLARTRQLMDVHMREGLHLALQAPRLLTHYWADPGQYRVSVAALDRPDGQFDVESFFAVLDDYAARPARWQPVDPITCPVLAVFGDHDPVTRRDEQWPAVKATLPQAELEQFADSGHYLHLDRPERFADRVITWADITQHKWKLRYGFTS
jgi:pimeloyl-ACP methyl ester carboxylesterase